MKHKQASVCTPRVLLFLFPCLQILAVFFLGVTASPHHIGRLALLYLLSLATVIWIAASQTLGTARLLFALPVLYFPLLGGVFFLVFGMYSVAPRRVHLCTMAVSDSEITYFSKGADYFAALLSAIRKAKHSVYLEYYIFDRGALWAKLYRALAEAAARGVRVELVADGFGSSGFLRGDLRKSLARANIRVYRFRPFGPLLSFALRLRNHRKLALIDKNIALLGGFNIADEYLNLHHKYGTFRDSGCLVRGAGAHAALPMLHTARASLDFMETGGNARLFSFACGSRQSEALFCALLQTATTSFSVATPYFAPTPPLLAALLLAAKRGVQITLLLPGFPDHPFVQRVSFSFLPLLLENGVKVYTFTPGFLHAKLCVADQSAAVVGSANWDMRSLALNAENGVLITDRKTIHTISQDLAALRTESAPCTVAHPRFLPAADRFFRFLSPLV